MSRTLKFIHMSRPVLYGMCSYYDTLQKPLGQRPQYEQRMHIVKLMQEWLQAWMALFPSGIRKVIQNLFSVQLEHHLFMRDGGTVLAKELFEQIDQHVMRLKQCLPAVEEVKTSAATEDDDVSSDAFWRQVITLLSMSLCMEEESRGFQAVEHFLQITLKLLARNPALKPIHKAIQTSLKEVELLWRTPTSDAPGMLDALWHLKNVLFHSQKGWDFPYTFKEFYQFCSD